MASISIQNFKSKFASLKIERLILSDVTGVSTVYVLYTCFVHWCLFDILRVLGAFWRSKSI